MDNMKELIEHFSLKETVEQALNSPKLKHHEKIMVALLYKYTEPINVCEPKQPISQKGEECEHLSEYMWYGNKEMLKCVKCGHKETKAKQSTSLKEDVAFEIFKFHAGIDNSNNVADIILKLIQSHILKEVKQAEPLRIEGESPDFTQGQEWTMRQVIKIINTIK